MTIVKKIKNNLFTVLLLLGIALAFIINKSVGTLAVKNTVYYVKEMLMIMPVVFILTALLDTWVPKETIMRFLGKESKSKGVFLSFVLGSISAGPIYAAFPVCVMLHKKGATVRNLMVILSAWAVIKVPMLVNEAKFLGPHFTIVRWICTVIAIIIFSWIASKIVKDDEIVTEIKGLSSKISVNKSACIGCKLCVKSCPEVFVMDGKKSDVRKDLNLETIDEEKLKRAFDTCPVHAIADNR